MTDWVKKMKLKYCLCLMLCEVILSPLSLMMMMTSSPDKIESWSKGVLNNQTNL